MVPLTADVYEDLEMAYGLMVEAKYRPAASSNGLGQTTGPGNLAYESRSYAEQWWTEEDSGRFFIGRSRKGIRVTTVLVVEAARLLCARILGGTKDNKLALRLLRMAVNRLAKESKATTSDGTFEIESNLQKALRPHVEQLEPGLKIIDGGKERTLKTGRVDILAEDKNHATVVIELKVGEADDHDVTQILRYMGELADSNQVRGILVAEAFSLRARAAASRVSSLRLTEYRYNFVFKI